MLTEGLLKYSRSPSTEPACSDKLPWLRLAEKRGDLLQASHLIPRKPNTP